MEDQPLPDGPNKDGPWASPERERHSTKAGAIAGVTTSVLCSPLDVLKTRQQVEGALAAKERRRPKALTLRCSIDHVLKTEGPRGFYRGLVPALATVPVFWATYFTMYDYAKRAYGSGVLRDYPIWMQHIASAVSAGAISDTITNPLWVLRTRLQTNALADYVNANKSMVVEARSLLKNEGAAALFKGLPATLLGLSHVAIQFPLYEKLKVMDAQANDANSPARLIAASVVSKAIASALTYPHEVVRSRLQFDRSKQGASLVSAIRTILSESGPQGLYAGFHLNMIRVLPACVTTFVSYEYLLAHFESLQKEGDDSN